MPLPENPSLKVQPHLTDGQVSSPPRHIIAEGLITQGAAERMTTRIIVKKFLGQRKTIDALTMNEPSPETEAARVQRSARLEIQSLNHAARTMLTRTLFHGLTRESDPFVLDGASELLQIAAESTPPLFSDILAIELVNGLAKHAKHPRVHNVSALIEAGTLLAPYLLPTPRMINTLSYLSTFFTSNTPGQATRQGLHNKFINFKKTLIEEIVTYYVDSRDMTPDMERDCRLIRDYNMHPDISIPESAQKFNMPHHKMNILLKKLTKDGFIDPILFAKNNPTLRQARDLLPVLWPDMSILEIAGRLDVHRSSIANMAASLGLPLRDETKTTKAIDFDPVERARRIDDLTRATLQGLPADTPQSTKINLVTQTLTKADVTVLPGAVESLVIRFEKRHEPENS